MPGIARIGDLVSGGVHCHGHPNGPVPIPTPGSIVQGATKVFAEGAAVARHGDQGHSSLCCAGIGTIVLQATQARVFVEGRPALIEGDPTVHCGMGMGRVASGSGKVRVGA